MNLVADYYHAFEISPVPAPAPDAKAPEVYRGIYGMPMFVTRLPPAADGGLAQRVLPLHRFHARLDSDG
jgi:hypothetical protein